MNSTLSKAFEPTNPQFFLHSKINSFRGMPELWRVPSLYLNQICNVIEWKK